MSSMCSTCLCENRKCVSLAPELKNIIIAITSENFFTTVDQKFICWECHAILRKINNFKTRALRTQTLLYYNTGAETKDTYIGNLTSLSIKTNHGFDKIWSFYEETENTEESPKVAVKDEDNIQVFVDDNTNNDITMHVTDDIDFLFKTEETPDVENLEGTVDELVKTGENLDPDKIIDFNNDQNNLNDKFLIYIADYEKLESFRDEDRKSSRYVSSQFKCDTCIKGFFTEDNYKAHMSSKHSEEIGEHSCLICHQRFATAASMAHHYDTHFKYFRCKYCAYEHHRYSTMYTHCKYEHGEDKFSCSMCLESFSKYRQLRYHIEKKHRDVTCKLCGKILSSLSSLKVHISLKHTKDEKPKVECPDCGKQLRNAQNLKCHLRRTHASNARVYCVECDMQFKTQALYKRHLLQHRSHRQADQLRFKCDYCDMKFVNKYMLKDHVDAVHLKNFAYVCDICNKGFIRQYRLKTHIRIQHEGIPKPKDKLCSFCGKGFTARQQLIKHIRIHTGERPFECEFCTMKFTQKSTLMTHKKALHLKKRKGTNE